MTSIHAICIDNCLYDILITLNIFGRQGVITSTPDVNNAAVVGLGKVTGFVILPWLRMGWYVTYANAKPETLDTASMMRSARNDFILDLCLLK